jgi:hypothetical protein
MSNNHYIIRGGRNQSDTYIFIVELNIGDYVARRVISGALYVIFAREMCKLNVYFRRQLDPIGDGGWKYKHIFGSPGASKE